MSNAALQRRRAELPARFHIVAHWLQTHQRSPELLSFHDIEAQATVSLKGGSDTLSCTLQAFVYFMIRHLESWQRARDEIKLVQVQGGCRDR
ncbi:hypothetical protein DL766_004845 [Monosporascus sp. MC13-8B]|uniref:Uncharacterized protein n=1 Tax=Monosporascus cannonballus TaxID=155416 RepID=A0ABY0H4Z9_9PEZI|nr:hypothetical protein DL762_007009 [Monosporascus cannonballus]RYP00609.1 hypothetical protein DL763_000663 [Monosporascus cannonballus]RYP30502.1 hypothetical protein DL766_004845 [Monosporascus sp. MC13-8B]